MTDRTDELGIEIRHRTHGHVIYATTTQSLRAAVSEAVRKRADLRGADLTGADLTGADLTRADLRGADLTGAYLTRADLTRADLRGADLTGADLTGADLTRAYLRGAYLRDADLRDADLTRAYLTGAYLTDADLTGAYLTGADLTRAKGLPLDGVPLVENLDAKILAAVESSQAIGKAGLDMTAWHTCESTHCRAGWAIHLAGKEGYELEERCGSSLAGALIYAKAGAERVPNFYASDEDALADMRERAGVA